MDFPSKRPLLIIDFVPVHYWNVTVWDDGSEPKVIADHPEYLSFYTTWIFRVVHVLRFHAYAVNYQPSTVEIVQAPGGKRGRVKLFNVKASGLEYRTGFTRAEVLAGAAELVEWKL